MIRPILSPLCDGLSASPRHQSSESRNHGPYSRVLNLMIRDIGRSQLLEGLIGQIKEIRKIRLTYGVL